MFKILYYKNIQEKIDFLKMKLHQNSPLKKSTIYKVYTKTILRKLIIKFLMFDRNCKQNFSTRGNPLILLIQRKLIYDICLINILIIEFLDH